MDLVPPSSEHPQAHSSSHRPLRWFQVLLLLLVVWSSAHLDHEQQLITVDAAAPIDVIEFKVPAELLLHLGLQHQAQRSHVLHEINAAVLQEENEPILSQSRDQEGSYTCCVWWWWCVYGVGVGLKPPL